MKGENVQLEELAQRLQAQRDVPLWVLASSATIIAISRGERECYGPRGRCFFRLFNMLGLSLAAMLALQLISIILVTIWWFQCRLIPQSERDAVELFIGFGAGPEKQMLERFRTESDRWVAHLNQADFRSLAQVTLPRLSQIWKTCFVDARGLLKCLRKAKEPAIRHHAQQWLVSAAIRFSDYVFFKSWVDALPGRVRRMVFVSPDIPAFATLDARSSDRFNIEYRQHGLLKKSIVFPRFLRVVALNRHEAAHLKKRIPAARVDFPELAMGEKKKGRQSCTLLFASIYDTGKFRKQDHLPVLRDVFAWAVGKGLRIIVRPHPCESGDFWEEHFPEIPHDETTGGFQETLLRYNPQFVASWWSTSLVDALRDGIAPVLIMKGSELALEDMVFPLHQTTFHWERDESLLTEMAASPVKYRDGITRLLQFI